jgi:hypothetical protein
LENDTFWKEIMPLGQDVHMDVEIGSQNQSYHTSRATLFWIDSKKGRW